MINQAQILGRVGKIERKTFPNGNEVTNVSIVTSKKYTKDGVKQEKVVWHNVSCFSKLADVAERYLAVGDLVYIQGEIDNHKFKGQDGIERSRSVIIAHEIKLMPKSKPHVSESAVSAESANDLEDDVPW